MKMQRTRWSIDIYYLNIEFPGLPLGQDLAKANGEDVDSSGQVSASNLQQKNDIINSFDP